MKKHLAVIFVLVFLLAGTAMAENKPSFLGTWYLQTVQTDGTTVSTTAPYLDAILKFEEDGDTVYTTITNGEEETDEGFWLEYDGLYILDLDKR